MFSHSQYIVLTVYISILCLAAAQNSGPYEIILEAVKNCQDKGTGDISVTATATTKKDGKMYHSGKLSLPTGLKDNMKAVGDATIWNNNEWKPIGFVWKLNFNKACTKMKNMAGLWFDILKAANVKPLGCPISEGTYNFVDYHVNTIGAIKKLKYGKYRVRLHIYKKNQKIGCLCYIANVVKA